MQVLTYFGLTRTNLTIMTESLYIDKALRSISDDNEFAEGYEALNIHAFKINQSISI